MSIAMRKKESVAAAISVAPMLCTLVDEPFDNDNWIFEHKYDGLRVLVYFDGRDLTLMSRNQASQNFQFPELVESLRASLKRPAIVDGEIVCLDEQGRSSFRQLQQRFHLENAAEVRERMKRYPASIFLFDVLRLNGRDLMQRPLSERKQKLRSLVRWSSRVRWTDYTVGNGRERFRQACRDREEGIVGKQLRSRYSQSRSGWWVKIKCIGRQEFVIGGFTDPQRSRIGLGALLAGYYSDDGNSLIYAGKVGTGFTNETLLDLRERLDKLEQTHRSFDEGEPQAGPNTHWVKPKLVAEIAFAEWTQNGLLRQPRFEGLRPDKKPRECRREVARKM